MYWSFSGRDKRRLLYIRTISGVPTVIRRKKIKGNLIKFTYNKRTFPFDMSRPAFRIKNTFFYICDVNKGQLHFDIDVKSVVAPELLDAILNRHIVKDLVSGLENPAILGYLIYVILGAGLGLSVGYILGIKMG